MKRAISRTGRLRGVLGGRAHGGDCSRTKGRYASATVRGSLWRTDDYCNGTLITVLRGKVDVLDLVLHKHFLISAGHTYSAPS